MVDDQSHYEVLGVPASADKEAIRAAYQEQLDDIRQEQARENASKKPNESVLAGAQEREARLRSAWQVLSDPYQRGRYDATQELGGGDGDADRELVEAEVVDDERELTPRELRARQRAEMLANRPPGMFSPAPSDKPSTWPANVSPPPPRARSIAMIIDLFVLYVLFTVTQIFVIPAIMREAYPEHYREFERAADCRTRFDDEEQSDRTSLAQLERIEQSRDCVPVKVAFAENEERPQRRLERDINRLEDRQDDLRNKFTGATSAISLGMLLVMLLYLVPSSIISGRTLGKKLMQVRVVMEDGSPLRASAAFKRYGLPVVAAVLVAQIGLGPIGFVLVLFFVLNWPRNANLQGTHDRMAKTIVVDG